jgi:hypothetical protein
MQNASDDLAYIGLILLPDVHCLHRAQHVLKVLRVVDLVHLVAAALAQVQEPRRIYYAERFCSDINVLNFNQNDFGLKNSIKFTMHVVEFC